MSITGWDSSACRSPSTSRRSPSASSVASTARNCASSEASQSPPTGRLSGVRPRLRHVPPARCPALPQVAARSPDLPCTPPVAVPGPLPACPRGAPTASRRGPRFRAIGDSRRSGFCDSGRSGFRRRIPCVPDSGGPLRALRSAGPAWAPCRGRARSRSALISSSLVIFDRPSIPIFFASAYRSSRERRW